MYQTLEDVSKVFDNLRRMWSEYADTQYRYASKRELVMKWHDGYISFLMGDFDDEC